MKNIEKDIKETKEYIKKELERLITNEVEVEYIKGYIELLKIQAILLTIKEQGSKERI